MVSAAVWERYREEPRYEALHRGQKLCPEEHQQPEMGVHEHRCFPCGVDRRRYGAVVCVRGGPRPAIVGVCGRHGGEKNTAGPTRPPGTIYILGESGEDEKKKKKKATEARMVTVAVISIMGLLGTGSCIRNQLGIFTVTNPNSHVWTPGTRWLHMGLDLHY